MSPNKKGKVANILNDIMNKISTDTYKSSIKKVEDTLNKVANDPTYKDGVKYVNKYIKELKKSGSMLENKFRKLIKNEQKRLAYYLTNLGKYIDKLGEEEKIIKEKPTKKTTKKTTKKAAVKKAVTKKIVKKKTTKKAAAKKAAVKKSRAKKA